MPRSPSVSAALFSLLLAGSCRPGGRAPDPDRKPAGERDADARVLAERLCGALHRIPARRVAECCGSASSDYTFEACAHELTRVLRSGTAELDLDAVQRCERSARDALVGCDWVTPSQPLPPPACRGLLQGRVAVGGRCQSSLECRSPLHCEGVSAGRPGRCAWPAPVGAACGSTSDALAAQLLERDTSAAHAQCADFCSLVSRRCEAAAQAGAACASTLDCGQGQGCVTGKCAAGAQIPRRSPAGQVCRTDLDCAVGGCIAARDGQKRCGMKCSATLDALSAARPALGLRYRSPDKTRAAER